MQVYGRRVCYVKSVLNKYYIDFDMLSTRQGENTHTHTQLQMQTYDTHRGKTTVLLTAELNFV